MLLFLDEYYSYIKELFHKERVCSNNKIRERSPPQRPTLAPGLATKALTHELGSCKLIALIATIRPASLLQRSCSKNYVLSLVVRLF